MSPFWHPFRIDVHVDPRLFPNLFTPVPQRVFPEVSHVGTLLATFWIVVDTLCVPFGSRVTPVGSLLASLRGSTWQFNAFWYSFLSIWV